MNQPSLFEKAQRDGDYSEDESSLLSSIAEVRELAREYFPHQSIEPERIRQAREARARNSGAHRVGMVAKYARARGYISIFDPLNAEWHDVEFKDAPPWAKWEARKRAELYRGGDRHAYDLTSAQIHEIWVLEHPLEDEGIVDEHPLDE